MSQYERDLIAEQTYEREMKKLQQEIESLRQRLVGAQETRYGLRYATGEGFVALDNSSGGYPWATKLAEAQLWHTAEDRDKYNKIIDWKGEGLFIPVTIDIIARDT